MSRCPDEYLPKPHSDYVLLRIERDRKTAGGLHIPDTAGNSYAVVAARGPGRMEAGKLVPVSAKIGKRVLLSTEPSNVGTFTWGGETFGLVRDGDIAATMPDVEPNSAVAIANELSFLEQ